jgi:hypothetical protein
VPAFGQQSSSGSQREPAFQKTIWSQVFRAGRQEALGSRKALESLCQHYWYPIYAFLRRWGYDRQQARDLTQGFFAYLLEQSLLQKADPHKGRFRSFMLGSLKMFVSNQETKEQALKRGGGARMVSIDEQTAEGRYAYEPATDLTPERLFDRRWALELLSEAMRRLEAEYQRGGLSDLFLILQPYLVGEQCGGFADLASRLNKSEGAARVMVCRLRNRFRKVIRDTIAATVSDPAQIETELKELQAALREN